MKGAGGRWTREGRVNFNDVAEVLEDRRRRIGEEETAGRRGGGGGEFEEPEARNAFE